jgi:hypothetical protein
MNVSNPDKGPHIFDTVFVDCPEPGGVIGVWSAPEAVGETQALSADDANENNGKSLRDLPQAASL